jgi:hypothetical protein
MSVVSMYTENRAKPFLQRAKHYLRGKRYTTAKKIARTLHVSNQIAGCVLVTLGWKKISNRVYECPSGRSA